MWDRALTKKGKQGHVSSRNSEGGLVKVGKLWVLGGGGCNLSQDLLRVLAHTPAFCRIWLQSSFSHVLALQLLVVSLILNAALEKCLYIEIGSAACLCSYILGENTKIAKDNTEYIQF
jgi:hypothetical protein